MTATEKEQQVNDTMTPPSRKTAPEGQTETWVYIGQVQAKDGVFSVFQPVTEEGATKFVGSDLWYNSRRIKATVVGGFYAAQVTRTDEATTLHGTPHYLGTKFPDEAQVALWQAKDQELRQSLQRQSAERSAAKKTEELDALVDPMRDVIKRCRSWEDFRAMKRAIMDSLDRAWDTRNEG